MTMLSVDFEKRLGAFHLEAHFGTAERAVALYGPSGSGKTTIVNAIAGLVRPDSGRIVADGTVLFDSATGIDVPAHRRGIGYVFQEGRLFPHITVRRNLHFGRWMRGLPHDGAAESGVVRLLELGALLDRRPGRLSGGERQRVAIGRALLMQPRLLLLDEPLASLDSGLKAEILPYLEALRDEAKIPIVYVSHQPDEVRRLATGLVSVRAGRVVAVGGPDAVAALQAA